LEIPEGEYNALPRAPLESRGNLNNKSLAVPVFQYPQKMISAVPYRLLKSSQFNQANDD
jgi:hypothetical protein